MNWYLEVLKKYAVFEGRARRTEYWMFFLFNVLISTGLLFIDGVSGLTKAANGVPPLYAIYTLAVFLPGLAVTVRRLHDTDHSGWALLIAFVPIIGGIILLIWMATDSSLRKNLYGPNPKSKVKWQEDENPF